MTLLDPPKAAALAGNNIYNLEGGVCGPFEGGARGNGAALIVTGDDANFSVGKKTVDKSQSIFQMHQRRQESARRAAFSAAADTDARDADWLTIGWRHAVL